MVIMFNEEEPFCSQSFCRMIVAGEVGLLARIGCNVCVFTLCCFLAAFVRSLAHSC